MVSNQIIELHLLTTYLVVLVVVVVLWSTMVALGRATISSLLPVAPRRRATIVWSLPAKASLRAIALVLLMRTAVLVLAVAAMLWGSAAAVLSWGRRAVAVVARVSAVLSRLASWLVGSWRGRARVGPARRLRGVVAVAVVTTGGLVVLHTVSTEIHGQSLPCTHRCAAHDASKQAT